MVLVMVDQVIILSARLVHQNNFTIEEFFQWLMLEEIQADGFQVLDRRTSLTPLRKLWLAWRTWIKG